VNVHAAHTLSRSLTDRDGRYVLINTAQGMVTLVASLDGFEEESRFHFAGNQSIIGAIVFNLYDRKNTWYKEFDVIEGEIFENDVLDMGMIFNLFLTPRFQFHREWIATQDRSAPSAAAFPAAANSGPSTR
jgi:hypothetical protein